MSEVDPAQEAISFTMITIYEEVWCIVLLLILIFTRLLGKISGFPKLPEDPKYLV